MSLNHLVFSPEYEIHGLGVDSTRNALSNAGIKGFSVQSDCGAVYAEINFAPQAYCQFAFDRLERVTEIISSAGADAVVGCGMHVHFANAKLQHVSTERQAQAFCRDSITHYDANPRDRVIFSRRPELLGDPINASVVRDLFYRWHLMQPTIETMQPKSRSEGNSGFNRFMSHSISDNDASAIAQTRTIEELLNWFSNQSNGKFVDINLNRWRTIGTIEFRKAAMNIKTSRSASTTAHDRNIQWIKFLANFYNHSIENRDTSPITRTVQTASNGREIFAAQAHRISQVYNAMRVEDGATVYELVLATGVSQVSVRRMVSEIRNRIGADRLITHTQRSQGHNYGAGDDLTRYEIVREYQERIDQTPNQLGATNPSIWAGMHDDDFDWWQDRIDELD